MTFFPPEIWIQIYNHLVFACRTHRKLAPFLLINRLAHSCIYPRLFETVYVLKFTLFGPSYNFLALPQPRPKTWIKRITMASSFFDTGKDKRALEILGECVESLQRLRCEFVPVPEVLPVIAAHRNVSFFEANVSLFVALQKSDADISWANSLTRLSLVLKGTWLDSSSYPTELHAVEMIDFTRFPHLEEVAVTDAIGSMSRPSPREYFFRQLERVFALPSFSIQLIVVICSDTRDSDLASSESLVGMDDFRVVYYFPHQLGALPEQVEESYTNLGELPESAVFQSRWHPRDLPLDDWGEVAFSEDLHLWSWAENARKQRLKRLTRKLGVGLN
ncbi:hypothetical protein DL96DRAFT_1595627 [Flagelloscypha sp. PMI_526]|nr:hypothetical protein DL96DRAFT_1595627 [Flagelloscypha sp. PMI_526]